jgi:hypothetical protein
VLFEISFLGVPQYFESYVDDNSVDLDFSLDLDFSESFDWPSPPKEGVPDKTRSNVTTAVNNGSAVRFFIL